jgi:diguanylate cyclase
MSILEDSSADHTPIPEEILAMMRSAGVQLSPENYHVWYEYAGGQNGALNSKIDRIRDAGRAFTPEISGRLYAEFFDDQRDDRAHRLAQKKTHAVLRGALAAILSSQEEAAAYRNSLTGFSGTLTKLTDTHELEELVKELVRESNRMAESSFLYQNQLEDVRAEAEKLGEELDKAMRDSSIDALTGLYNRKAVDEKAEELVREFREEGDPFCAVMVDVDHFREFNTTHGHQIGDAVLRVVSATLRDSVKGMDFVARYGGEEFVLFFPKTVLDNATIVADKMRMLVEGNRKKISRTGKMLDPITISCGVAQVNEIDTPDSLIHRADQALYLAKNNGRNRVETERSLTIDDA